MSASGQKQTLRLVRLMSALPQKADIDGRRLHVRFVPKAEVADLYLTTSSGSGGLRIRSNNPLY